MVHAIFASQDQLIGGLLVGICFGFLLRKAHVTRFDIIVKQLLLQDFTVMKVMLTAIAFGSLGISVVYLFAPNLSCPISATTLSAAALGGGIFGIGMALMGFCPGTAIGALADGAKDIYYGLLGMVAGGLIFAEISPFFTNWIKSAELMNQSNLSQLTGWPRPFFSLLFLGAVLLMKLIDWRASIRVKLEG